MTAGRPIEFDPQHVLDAATHAFWRQGYEATSLDNLLGEMEIGRSSFYQAFGSKSDLFQRCLENYRDASADRLRSQLDRAPSGIAFLESIFESVAAGTNDPLGRAGCLLMNTANEFAQRDPRIASLVRNALEQIEDLFYAALCRAQAEGDIPGNANIRSLSSFLMTSLGGLRGTAKSGATPEKIRTIAKVIINGLK